MKLVVEFDVDVDIIDVPQSVIDNKDILRKKFLRWLHNKRNKHNYWKKFTDSNGSCFYGLQYRSDAFVDWLNQKVLVGEEETATILEQQTIDYIHSLPRIFL